MDDQAGADAAMQAIQAYVAETLRRQLPYLKTEALDTILSESQQVLRTRLDEQQPAMDASRSRISFFKLSAELRNRIYELAIPPQDIVMTADKEKVPRHTLPTLTRVSRQIRLETLPIFYGTTKFKMVLMGCPRQVMNNTVVRETKSWLRMIGPKAIRMLKEVEIVVTNPIFGKEETEGEFCDEAFEVLGLRKAGVKEEVCEVGFYGHRMVRDGSGRLKGV